MAATKRSRSEWWGLIEAHRSSGLTMKAFCHEQGIRADYFSTKRRELEAMDYSPASAFTAITLRPSSTDSIHVEHGASRIQLPATVSAEWLATLVRSLGE